MQKYVSEPNLQLDGCYIVSVWNEVKSEYVPLEDGFLSQELAQERARQLNDDYQREIYEYKHQNELIDKYHGYAHSDDIQKQNAAEAFSAGSHTKGTHAKKY